MYFFKVVLSYSSDGSLDDLNHETNFLAHEKELSNEELNELCEKAKEICIEKYNEICLYTLCKELKENFGFKDINLSGTWEY